MSVCFKNRLKKIPLFYNCGYCNKIHFGNKELSFYNYKNEKYYCTKYIIEPDLDFNLNKSMSRVLLEILYDSANINQKMKIANDILKGYKFRRQCNGESIYIELYDVLRIENDTIYLNVYDEYYDIFDIHQKYMFDFYETRFLKCK